MVAVIVASGRSRLRGYAEGGWAVGVPHSPQNFAVGLSEALQFVQCFCVGVPHSPQNFAPTVTGLLQLLQATIADSAAGAAGAAAGGGPACWGAACGAAAAACCA
jgi:hypothetical protein